MNRVPLWPRLVGVLVALGLGIYYIGFVILGFSFTSSGYDVTAQVSNAAGLFVGSSVTYRGVQVGKVTDITPTPRAVDVTLHVGSRYEIPADSDANVRMLSALGEQYVDLMPPATGPTLRAPKASLHDGSVIPISRTSVPLKIGTVLHSADQLLSSLDPHDIHSLETLLSQAFSHVTPQLKRLISTGQDLTNALIKAKSGTRQLIVDGKTVLDAGNATSSQLKTYVAALDTISKQFVTSNKDFANLLSGGGGALTKVEQFLNTESQPFKDLLHGAGKAGDVVSTHQAGVNALFAVLPSVSQQLGDAAKGGTLSGTLFMNDGQPLCSYAGAGALPLPGARTPPQGSATSCPTMPGLQARGPQNAPGGG